MNHETPAPQRPLHRHSRLALAVAASAGLALLASACSASAEPGQAGQAGQTDQTESRVAVTTEGGITVLDASDVNDGTLTVVGDVDTEEFTRVNAFGDGRHVLVTTSRGFEVLDTVDAELTGLVFPATAAGHVVRHADTTALYDDGTGRTTLLAKDSLSGDNSKAPEALEYEAAAPHHGVSLALEDGTLLTTVGDETSRSGAAALASHGDHWDEVAVSAECPGIHGEGTAQHEVAVFGCEDGALMFRDGSFKKLAAPDAFGRMGNAYVSETSPIVVGDYKNDPDAEGYLLDAVSLIDTEAASFTVVELPEQVRYTYRDVVRGPDEHAYILSTDGAIHVLDPSSGRILKSMPVIDAWEGPVDWQDAHPTITADGETAYVTDPAARAVHAVNLRTGETLATATLPGVPNEIAVALN